MLMRVLATGSPVVVLSDRSQTIFYRIYDPIFYQYG